MESHYTYIRTKNYTRNQNVVLNYSQQKIVIILYSQNESVKNNIEVIIFSPLNKYLILLSDKKEMDNKNLSYSHDPDINNQVN